MADIHEHLEALEVRIMDISTKILGCQTETQVLVKEFTSRLNTVEERTNKLTHRDKVWDQKFRKNNLILFGLEECQPTDLIARALSVINDTLGLEILPNDVNNIYRLGKQTDDKKRPTLIELISYLKKVEILRSATKFRNTDFSIRQDRSPEEVEIRKKLLKHLEAANLRSLNAKLVNNNKLLINGELYTLDQLDNESGNTLTNNNDQLEPAKDLPVPDPVVMQVGVATRKTTASNISPLGPIIGITKRPATSPPVNDKPAKQVSATRGQRADHQVKTKKAGSNKHRR